MSPKDAIGADPEFGEPLYKHVPFYIRVNEEIFMRWDCLQ